MDMLILVPQSIECCAIDERVVFSIEVECIEGTEVAELGFKPQIWRLQISHHQ